MGKVKVYFSPVGEQIYLDKYLSLNDNESFNLEPKMPLSSVNLKAELITPFLREVEEKMYFINVSEIEKNNSIPYVWELFLTKDHSDNCTCRACCLDEFDDFINEDRIQWK